MDWKIRLIRRFRKRLPATVYCSLPGLLSVDVRFVAPAGIAKEKQWPDKGSDTVANTLVAYTDATPSTELQ